MAYAQVLLSIPSLLTSISSSTCVANLTCSRFTAFDIVPSSPDDFDNPFEERYGVLLDTVSEDHAFIISFFLVHFLFLFLFLFLFHCFL